VDFVDILTTHDCDVIKISGGEPTILNIISMYIREAKLFAETILYTNLTRIPSIDPDHYLVSFYGTVDHPRIVGDYVPVNKTIKNILLRKDKVTLNTPVFSEQQLIGPLGVLDFAMEHRLPIRMTRLISHGGARHINVLSPRRQLEIAEKAVKRYDKAYYTCSLGGSLQCESKTTITPSMEEITCTAEIRGETCFRKIFSELIK